MKDKKIPQRYRKVITLLFRAIVFTDNPRKGFSWSLRRLSREVQRQFIDAYDLSHGYFVETFFKRMEPYLSSQLIVSNPEGQIEVIEFDIPDKRTHFMKCIQGKLGKDFFSEFAQFLVISSDRYFEWGCTPHLALDPIDKQFKMNCFGRTLALGSYCVKKRIRIEMGITPDHPIIIAYIGNVAYAMDKAGGTVKLKGVFEKRGTYKVYRPLENELEPFNMVMVFPFDHAVLYELFENMEVLRRVSLGMECTLLPNTRLATTSVAKAYASTLQLVSWKELQAQLFPEITAAFIQHHTEWQEEVIRIGKKRRHQYLDDISTRAAQLAQEKTSFARRIFEKSQAALREIFKEYDAEIMLYLWAGVPFSETVPDDVRNYFQIFRTEMEKADAEDPGVAEKIYRIINTKLVDMKIKQEYKQENILTQNTP